MIKKTLTGLGALVFASSAVADVVDTRRAVMDQVRMGAATLVPMLKGETKFDAQVADLALRMTYAASIAFSEGDLFPAGSESKGANPAIWEKLDDFTAKRAEFVVNGAAAVKAQPKDLEALMAVYQPMLENCAACNKDYRIKDE